MPEPREVEWLTLGQLYPTGTEFLVLLSVMLQLILGGYLLKAVLVDKHQLVPIKWATIMLLVAVAVFVIQTSLLLPGPAAPERSLVVLFWCLAFALIPMWFYIKTFVDALSDQSTQRLSPMGTKIEEFSEFSAARKLAQKGDIDGAVTLYRGYRENRPRALLEAARLLRTEERYADAVSMFQEISERFPDNKPVWAESTYNLAKLMETNLNQPVGAMQYLQQIRKRVPDTRYAQMADSDMSRLQVMTGKKVVEIDGIPEEHLTGHPDIAKVQVPAYNRENVAQDLLDAPIPEKDPFLTRDIYTVRGAKPKPSVEQKTHKAIAKKAAIAKKKSSRKKASTAKAPEKPKAKKKPAKKKTATKAKAKTTTKAKAKAKAKPKPKAKSTKSKAVPKAKPKTIAKKKAAAIKKAAAKPES